MSKFAKWLGGAAAVALALGSLPANAQTPIKFTLDWVFQGPTSPFLVALEKGYYKAEGLDVTMDPGQGSAGAVQRVATGAYQIGFADVNATIEYNAKNPGKEVLCVFMAYDFAPFGVYALKKSGIKVPKDLEGKKLGAPVFDASFRLFPAFAKLNGISKWEHVNLTPQLREQSLVQGTVDFISGHYFSSMLDLKARGVKFDDIVAMRYVDFGMDVYGTNTRLEQVDLGKFAPGDELETQFSFDCWLTPQEYTLTVATQNADGSSHDWVDDAIAFEVVDAKAMAGVANLRAEVKWTKRKREHGSP